MLYNILMALLFVDAVLLVAAILLQAGKGGGLAATFGGVSSSADAILGTRAAGNLLTKASWWCGGLFLGLAFVLSLMATRTRRPTSVLDEAFTAPPAAAPAPRSAAPALPLEEAAPPAGTKGQPAGKARTAAPSPSKTPGTKTPGTKSPAAPAPTSPAPRATKSP
ncbi:MAG: preprotein translocase subunit SecG [Gemmatimonadaceae bacterium]